MLSPFSDYLNNVTANKTLKDNTKKYVYAMLNNREIQEPDAICITQFKKSNPLMKKIIFSFSSVAACAVLALGGFAYYNNPINYISLDINPSVEFGINAFDRIVSVQSYNEDGLLLLENNEYLHLSIETAVNDLVQAANEQGFIMEDGTSVIAVTAESDSENAATKLQKSCQESIDLALNTDKMSAIIYTAFTNLQLRTQAQEAGVSPGKFRLIEILQSLDPSITVEQYKSARITDLITAANEMLTLSEHSLGNNPELADTIDEIRTAARQVQAASINIEQDQNQQVENSNQQQTHNQGSDSMQQNQAQTPSQTQNSAISSPEQQPVQEQQMQSQTKTDSTSVQAGSTGEEDATDVQCNSGVGSGDSGSASGGGANSSDSQAGSGSGGKK